MKNYYLKISKNVAWQKEPTENFIYLNNVNTDTYYSFSDVAGEIWICIVEGQDYVHIVQFLIDKYGENDGTIKRDVMEFVEVLVEKGLIEVND